VKKPKEVGIHYARINRHVRHVPESIRFGRGCILRHKGPTMSEMYLQNEGGAKQCQRWQGTVRAWTVTLISYAPSTPVADATIRFQAFASHEVRPPNRSNHSPVRASLESVVTESWERALEDLHRGIDSLYDGIEDAFPERAEEWEAKES